MRRPAHPCPVCGRARHVMPSGSLTVLCKPCWLGVPKDEQRAYNDAGAAFAKDRKGQYVAMLAARDRLIQQAKLARGNLELAL